MSGAVDQIFISKWKINPESAKSYLYLFWGFVKLCGSSHAYSGISWKIVSIGNKLDTLPKTLPCFQIWHEKKHRKENSSTFTRTKMKRTLVWCKNVMKDGARSIKTDSSAHVSLKSVRLYLFDLSNTLTVFLYSNLSLSSLSPCLPFTVNVTLKNNGVRLDAVIKAMRFWEVIMDIFFQTTTTIIEIVHIIWIYIFHIEPEFFLRVRESWWRDRWLLTTTINTITRQALECIFFYCLLTCWGWGVIRVFVLSSIYL